MKPVFICFLFIILYQATSFATPTKDSLVDELNNAIKHADDYDNNKLKEIFYIEKPIRANFKKRYKPAVPNSPEII